MPKNEELLLLLEEVKTYLTRTPAAAIVNREIVKKIDTVVNKD